MSFRTSSSPASRESMSGTVRIEMRARAESTIWFDEPWIGCDSKAITVNEGRVQIDSKAENPFSPVSLTPGRSPACRASLLASKGSRRKRARSRAEVWATLW